MRRMLVVVVLLGSALGGGQAFAGAGTAAPILYDGGLRCPGLKSGVNMGACATSKYATHIYEIAKVGFPAHALTSGSGSDTHPVWSPNHAQIAFFRSPIAIGGPTATYLPTKGTALWLMKADGSGQKKLVLAVTLSGNGGPTWSPDGSHLAFSGLSPDGKTTDIYSVKSDGTGLVDLTSNPDSAHADYPSWSPTGAEIIFRHRFSPGFPGTWQINSNGSGAKSLLRGGIMFAWIADGSKFAYVANDAHGRLEVFVVNGDGSGAATQLTSGSQYSQPSWSPDGSRLVLVRANQIAVINADGTGLKQLTKLNPAGLVENPDW